jgi:beta-galactosidase
MRKTVHLNFDWKFGVYEESHQKGFKLDTLKSVNIPHNAVDILYSNFDETMTQGLFSYHKKINISEEDRNKTFQITFEGIAHRAVLYVNQLETYEHLGGYTPFTVDITDKIICGIENTIFVLVDTRENPIIPPFGGVVDYLGYGGIYREVRLDILDKFHIKDIFVEQYGKPLFVIHIELSSPMGHLDLIVKDPFGHLVYHKKIEVSSHKIKYTIQLSEVALWSLEFPNLYELNVKLLNDHIIDEQTLSFGIREAIFKNDGFYLNGKKVKIRGLNRHQSYPYVGYAMPKHAQIEDADILKFDLGVNLVRTAHYPQSKHFLDRCDKIGLMVFEEIPGWQHIGGKEWKEISYQNTKDMIIRDRNHPSVILWGVRINESPDDHDFYKKTNEIANKLDPSRQTGGVRNFQFSEFLEDVYTYNDFSHTGGNPGLDKKKNVTKDVPYLVTEYNGHMFPTKRYDSESHRIEHAKRHLNVLNAMMEPNNKISGAIGWCMADYNTHQEFGSGDKICHHGVLDMFRIPKIASYAYTQEGIKNPFMEVASTMNIGEYPGGNLEEIYVFTNLDYIKLYKNDEYINTFYPNRKRYQNLNHPPIIIDDFVGDRLTKNEKIEPKDSETIKDIFRSIVKNGNNLSLKHKLKMLMLMKKYKMSRDDGVKLFFKYFGGWGTQEVTYKIEGYQSLHLIKTIYKSNNHQFKYLLETNSHQLKIEETYDVKRFIVKKINQDQEIIPFAFDILEIRCEGSIELIGPKKINLIGGAIGFYVKTKSKGKGKIEVLAENQKLSHEVNVL